MSAPQPDVERTIRSFLARVNKPVEQLPPDLALFAEGIRLDSLETAELSAILEDEFGRDPFSGETMPQTIGDIVNYYATAPLEA